MLNLTYSMLAHRQRPDRVTAEPYADPDLAASSEAADRGRDFPSVDNALRYTPAGGQIVLAASAEAAGVRFDVRDSGPGVAPEDLPHMFERFYQADPSRDRARGSSGLGLAIVKALAEAQGGIVGVQNAPPGGADFWIRLPAA